MRLSRCSVLQAIKVHQEDEDEEVSMPPPPPPPSGTIHQKCLSKLLERLKQRFFDRSLSESTLIMGTAFAEVLLVLAKTMYLAGPYWLQRESCCGVDHNWKQSLGKSKV